MNKKIQIILILVTSVLFISIAYVDLLMFNNYKISEHNKNNTINLSNGTINLSNHTYNSNGSFHFINASDLQIRFKIDYDQYYKFFKNNSEIESVDFNITKINLNTNGTTIIIKNKNIKINITSTIWYLNNNTLVIE